MKLRVLWVGKTRSAPLRALTAEYLKRLGRYVSAEGTECASEAALLRQAEKGGGRTRPLLVLLDGGGRPLSSEELAEYLEKQEAVGTQQVVFAVGGADGWSAEARRSAALTLSLGRMTLAHELARVVLLEQLYRAYTILKRHPYHSGH